MEFAQISTSMNNFKAQENFAELPSTKKQNNVDFCSLYIFLSDINIQSAEMQELDDQHSHNCK